MFIVGKTIFEGCFAEQKSEGRNPRAERNPNSEGRTNRRSNPRNPGFCACFKTILRHEHQADRFRISVFELLSAFGIRRSDLFLHITNVEEPKMTILASCSIHESVRNSRALVRSEGFVNGCARPSSNSHFGSGARLCRLDQSQHLSKTKAFSRSFVAAAGARTQPRSKMRIAAGRVPLGDTTECHSALRRLALPCVYPGLQRLAKQVLGAPAAVAGCATVVFHGLLIT